MNTTLKPDPAIIVIFGVTGDLVKRKLFPALYNLIKNNLLHPDTIILGITRQEVSQHQILIDLIDGYPEYDKSSINFFRDRFIVQTMDVTNGIHYRLLYQQMNKIEEQKGLCMNRLYYLSIPPQISGPIVRFLGESGLNKSCQHNVAETRLLLEKPFGYDLNSAKQLILDTSKYFRESQIFRIDHYLAKETVQNILTFRFSNAIFESIWNHNYIARIDIIAKETIGIEGRSIFYEQTGALRDLIQSHLLQLLAIVTMEEPADLTSQQIHKSKLNLLKSVKPVKPDQVNQHSFRGQYATYKTEVNNPKSNVETFAATEINIDNPRWHNVPIIISTGKALDEKKTIIKVVFKSIGIQNEILKQHNSLSFRIQPNEGIGIELIVKKPGLETELQNVEMDFSYNRFFSESSQPDAYERVLVDSTRGDHTLFATSEEVLESWKIIDSILLKWAQDGQDLQIYKNNSDGPMSIPGWLEPNYKI